MHETINELHHKILNGVILKINFEKAYNEVKWAFLLQTLRMKVFLPKWITWVQCFILGGSVVINVNNNVGAHFQTKKLKVLVWFW